MRWLKNNHDEGGFTLVEVSLVATIIGVLIGIAIPTFSGTVGRASDRVAQERLVAAAVTARAAATDSRGLFQRVVDETTVPFDAAVLMSEDRTLSLTDNADRVDGLTMGVKVPDASNTRLHLWIQASSSSWFGILIDALGGNTYCEGVSAAAVSNAATCTAPRW